MAKQKRDQPKSQSLRKESIHKSRKEESKVTALLLGSIIPLPDEKVKKICHVVSLWHSSLTLLLWRDKIQDIKNISHVLIEAKRFRDTYNHI